MAIQTVNLQPRSLFGGAISLQLPVDYLDASDLRQIPDNQEVFLSAKTTTSIMIEVLQMVKEGLAKEDLFQAAKFHFDSLAHDNTALSSTIYTQERAIPCPAPNVTEQSLPPSSSSSSNRHSVQTPEPTILTGIQSIHKYTHDPSGLPRPGHESDQPDTVWIGLALWRCWLRVEGDAGVSEKKADLICTVNVNLSEDEGEREKQTIERWWIGAVEGLRIENWDLFGDE